MNKNPEDMDIEERRKTILELLNAKGKVRVNELARLFATSEVTIRCDLTELENEGLLERVHGGAVGTYKAYINMSFQERARTRESEKRAVAQYAASLVSDGDTVLMNSGSTIYYVAQELSGKKSVNIVTNSVLILQQIDFKRNQRVILLGGNFDEQNQFTYGDDALQQLSRYRTDKFIMSVDGLSLEEGITTYNYLEAEVNRRMMERAKSTIVVCDYSKIGRSSFSFISGVENVGLLVTNKEADEEEVRLIREAGVNVALV